MGMGAGATHMTAPPLSSLAPPPRLHKAHLIRRVRFLAHAPPWHHQLHHLAPTINAMLPTVHVRKLRVGAAVQAAPSPLHHSTNHQHKAQHTHSASKPTKQSTQNKARSKVGIVSAASAGDGDLTSAILQIPASHSNQRRFMAVESQFETQIITLRHGVAQQASRMD